MVTLVAPAIVPLAGEMLVTLGVAEMLKVLLVALML
jgi:hypothetical protein